MQKTSYASPTYAAKLFRLSPLTVWVLIRHKMIESKILRQQVVIDPSLLEGWINAHPYEAMQLKLPTYHRDKSFKIIVEQWR